MVTRDASSSAALARYAWLSLAAAFATLALKILAWVLTSSVGLLSDALESLVNVGAAVMLLAMLRIAGRPADDEHAYGRDKAEYFASGFEGMLVVISAVVPTAIAERWFLPDSERERRIDRRLAALRAEEYV